MSGLTVEVIGVEKLRTSFKGLSANVLKQVRAAVAAAALNLEREAKTRCPVRTGRLRSSIATSFYARGLTATVGTNVTYASHVEFGTRRQRAQPFLGPAWDVVQPAFLREVAAAVNSAIDEAP